MKTESLYDKNETEPVLEVSRILITRGPFDKFVDCRQCAAVMQREAVTVMPSCSGGGNVVVE
jgi:hypothetical protein